MKRIYVCLLVVATVFVVLQSCNDYEPAFGVPDVVQFENSSVAADESATSPLTVTVQFLGPQKATPIDVEYSLDATNLTEGVDYEFVGSKTITIPANSSTATLQIQPIDNDEISENSKFLTLTLTGASQNIGIGSEKAPNQSIQVNINEDDFFCPRNLLSKVVTTETDLGYSSTGISIEITTSPSDCLGFEIIGGGGSLFGTTNIKYGPISLVEDAPESMTGTITGADVKFFPRAGGNAYTDGDGNEYSMTISNGTYDLENGTFQMDYIFYAGATPQFPGTLIYD